MPNLSKIALFAAAGAALASLSGCVTTTTTRNGVTVTVNGFNVNTSIGANSAADTVQKKFIGASVSSLQLNSSEGSISVQPSDLDEILVQATRTIHGSDSPDKLKPLLSSVTVQAELTNGALVLSSKQPSDFEKRNISVTVDYVVTVPRRLALDLKTRSGSISVAGIQGGSKLHSDYGSLDLKDVGADLDVSSSSGSVSIIHAVNAKRIVAKSSYGDVTLKNVSGDVSAETQSGQVNLENAIGSFKVHSDYGNVKVTAAAGNVDASSSSGTVKLSDTRVTDSLKMHSDYGNVEATDVTSSGPQLTVQLTTQSGSATFKGDASDLTLKSDYGSVECELGGALPLHGASLNSSSGNVSLTLPSTVSAKVNASTSSGSVELPTGSTGNSGSFTLGSGSAQVSLESSYGNVVLRTK